MRKLRNRKLNNKKLIGLTAIILAGGLLTSCTSILSRKEYEYTRVECTSDGEYYEAKQFKPFDPNTNKNLPNSFIYYGKWNLDNNGKYSRDVREYNANKITLDEITTLINDEEIEIEKELGKPTKEYTQVSEFVTEEELGRDSYFSATVYGKNDDKYVIIKNENSTSIILLAGGIFGLTAGIGSLITWNQYEEKSKKKLTLKKRDN